MSGDEDETGRRGPHPVDRHVGFQLRLRRRQLGLSQEKLAEALGLTFQQVQKYERGANRVSASRLWELARALEVSVDWFFDGLEGSDAAAAPEGGMLDEAREFLLTPEGVDLALAFPRVSAPLRRRLLELIRGLAEPAPGGLDETVAA